MFGNISDQANKEILIISQGSLNHSLLFPCTSKILSEKFGIDWFTLKGSKPTLVSLKFR